MRILLASVLAALSLIAQERETPPPLGTPKPFAIPAGVIGSPAAPGVFRSRVPSSLFSVGFPGLLARADGEHSHNGSSPFDNGCEKRWGQDRPVDHDGPLAATTLVCRRVID